MSTKPDTARQIHVRDIEIDSDARIWASVTAEEMRAEGMTWFRFTRSDEHDLILVEGWKVRPDQETEPEFFLTVAA